MATPPENLNIYLTNAFNAKYFDFIGSPVFSEPTYSVPVNFGPYDKTYDFPEGVQFNGVANFLNFSDDELVDSASNFQQKFSVGISAGGKVKRLTMGAEASLSSKLATNAKLSHSTSQKRFFSFAVQTIYQIERATPTATTTDFANAIKGLPTSLANSSDFASYESFFNQYGTHYLIRGSMGGFFCVQTDVDKTLLESDTAAAISGALSASFNASIASGTFKLESEFEKGQYLKDSLEGTRSRYSCRGGIFDTDLHNWVMSCFRNPILVPGISGINEPVLKPLSDYAPTAIQPVMEQALRSYLAGERHIGTPQWVELATHATASSSGLLVASVTAQADYLQANLQGLLGANQKVIGGCASVAGTLGINSASFCVPINAGDEYHCVVSTTSPAPVTSIQFVPISGALNDGSCFAAPVPLDVASGTVDFVPPRDGLLVGMATSSAQNCAIMLQRSFDDETVMIGGCMGGSDNAYVSCTIPVLAGITITGTAGYYSGTGTSPYNLNFIALQNGLKWGKPRLLAIGNKYTASSDGLVTGLAMAASNLISAGITVADSLSTFDSVVLSAGATSFSSGANTGQSLYNSLTVPVRKGQVFQPTCSVASATCPVLVNQTTTGATFVFYPLEEIGGLATAVAQIATRPN